MEILKTKFWLQGMCQTLQDESTPFREQIRLMPGE